MTQFIFILMMIIILLECLFSIVITIGYHKMNKKYVHTIDNLKLKLKEKEFKNE